MDNPWRAWMSDAQFAALCFVYTEGGVRSSSIHYSTVSALKRHKFVANTGGWLYLTSLGKTKMGKLFERRR